MTAKGDENELLRSVALQNAASILTARRSAERRNEAYLAEAQRLSHTGSFGWKASTGEIIWSEETFRIFQYDRTTTPTAELILQRVHPEDAALVRQTIERASQDGKDFDFEHRLLMPDGSIKHVHVVAHAERDESGELEFVGAVMDTTESKRAEKKLRRSEESLLEAQKLSHTGSWRHDVASGEVTVSPEIYRIHDIKPDDDPSNTEFFFSKFHPEDRNRVVELFERSENEKTAFQVDYRIVLPDGTIKHLHTIGRPVLNGSGDLMEFVGTVMDVTAAKRVEESLRQTENYLAEAQRLTHTGSWAWRVAGRDASHLSEEWYRIYGFDPEEGLSAWEKRLERMHPEDRVKWQETTDRAIREKTDYEGEHRIFLPDGTVKHTHTVGHPVLNASGDVVEFVGTMMDITDRKRAEEALRQSEAYLAEAQRLSHTGSWAGAPGMGEIRYWSEECYRVLGFDPQGGQPRVETFFQRIHPEDQARTIEQLERAGREKTEFAFDYRIIHPGGEIRSIHTVGHPVFSPSGELIEFVGTVIDVTDRKRAEEERERLRQAQADLARVNRVTTMGELTASLAHEVNQPIAAALTNANTCLRWLARDVPDVEEARAAAMRIVKDQTRAAEIVSRIRMLFKKGSAQRESVDLNEVIQEMIVLLRGETTRYSISVRADLASDPPQVLGDRVQLQQVLMNLMINGIDAMKEVGGTRELTIKSQRGKNKEVIVSVSDTGVGLPPQQTEQIFNAFFTTKAHGTGMGLRISRSIVESHDGRLWAADNPPRGTTFHFTLPAKVEADEFPPRSQAWIQ